MSRLRLSCVLLAVALIGAWAACPALAQPPGGGFGGGPPGFGPGGDTIGLLMNDQVRSELEIVDEQEEQLRELGDQMRQTMRSVMQETQDLPQEERFQAMRDRMSEERQKIEGQLKEILLDHQLERLKQLQLQSQMQRGGAVNALGSDEVREALGLTEDQIQKMRETAEEAERELRETIQKATVEAREKVLSVLTPAQQAKWKELTGTQFEFSTVGGRGNRGQGNFQRNNDGNDGGGGRRRGNRGQ